VGCGLRGNGSIPKQPKPNGTPSKKSAVKLVWLPLWLAAVLLAVMTRNAARPHDKQTARPSSRAQPAAGTLAGRG
jgi:hypothetical protein